MKDELFDLCKQVYEATGWEDVRDFYHENDTFDEETQTFKRNGIFSIVERKRADYNIPLYTSDYLLEKLPTAIKIQDPDIMEEPHVEVHHSGVVKSQYRWCAKAFNGDWFEVSSDTPLKSLLKLTLALLKEGNKE